eukprot:scaffold25330_cov51-Attheya_sp.AAC.4
MGYPSSSRGVVGVTTSILLHVMVLFRLCDWNTGTILVNAFVMSGGGGGGGGWGTGIRSTSSVTSTCRSFAFNRRPRLLGSTTTREHIMMRSLSCRQNNDSHDNNNSDEEHVWITELEAQSAAQRDNCPLTIWEGTWVDVSTVEPWSQTRLLRLRPEYEWTPVHEDDDHDHHPNNTTSTGTMDDLPTTNKGQESEGLLLLQRGGIQEWERTANEVARVTMDWCRDFVLPLHLCPWAKASVQSQSTAIRIKVIPQTHGFFATTTPVRGGGGGGGITRSSSTTTTGRRMDMDDIGMEPALRTAALELLLLTGQITLPSSNNNKNKNKNKNDDDDMMSGPVSVKTVDPNVAITFLVAAPLPPKSFHDEYKSLELVKEPHLFEFEFENFYQSVTDLEDQLFEEADRFNEKNAQKQQGNNNPVNVKEYENGMLGDLITMAPFHPDWEFASENGNDSDDHAAIQYEKKAPYPMISLVCTSAITEAGEIVSQTIGQQNAETLTHMGPHALGQLFRSAISPRRQQQQ